MTSSGVIDYGEELLDECLHHQDGISLKSSENTCAHICSCATVPLISNQLFKWWRQSYVSEENHPRWRKNTFTSEENHLHEWRESSPAFQAGDLWTLSWLGRLWCGSGWKMLRLRWVMATSPRWWDGWAWHRMPIPQAWRAPWNPGELAHEIRS